MVDLSTLPTVRGSLEENADIAKASWFRVGGTADILFKPADADDLSHFLKHCPTDTPITILGLCSNVIIRDGGIRGVVIKLGKQFASVSHDPDTHVITAGAGVIDMNVANYAAKHGLGGVEFLIGIPGSIGGAVKMNAGAYHREISDILVDCQVITRNGEIKTLSRNHIDMHYRHTDIADDIIVLSARLQTTPDDPEAVKQRLEDIKTKRSDSQPVKERTGGSTFANPDDHKAWELVDSVGGRGFQIGGAKMSEKHCNFMINTGNATACDLENLGDEMIKRVQDKHGITLRWEIKRIGETRE